LEAGEVYVMNCQEFWNTMPELGDVEAAAHQHLNDCSACAERLSRSRELTAGLRALAVADRRVGAPARVEARLRSAFRAGLGRAAARPARPVAAPVAAWALTLAAVLALAFVIVERRTPQLPRHPATAMAEVAAVATDDAQTE
jgi:hypothetical protein